MNMWNSTDLIAVTFAIIVVGIAVGKIRLFQLSLDLAAVLIVSLVVGYMMTRWSIATNKSFEDAVKYMTDLGSSIFVSCVGIAAGHSYAVVKRKDQICFFLLGSGMVLGGYLLMRIIALVDTTVDVIFLRGVFCGAMTSTPGLSALCEVMPDDADRAVWGYGCAYPFGVLGIVMFAQLMARGITPKNDDAQLKVPVKTYTGGTTLTVLMGVTIVLGSFLARIPILALGNSGGMLCVGVILGFLMAKRDGALPLAELNLYRNLGLMLFLVGAGLSAGKSMIVGIDVKGVLYGIALVFACVAAGYLVCRNWLKRSKSDCAFAVVGGMTSTPAVGVLQRGKTYLESLSVYSTAYIGALLTMVLIVRIPF